MSIPKFHLLSETIFQGKKSSEDGSNQLLQLYESIRNSEEKRYLFSFEVCWAAVLGKLAPSDISKSLSSCVKEDVSLQRAMLDAFYVVEKHLEIAGGEKKKSQFRSSLITLIRCLHEKDAFDRQMMGRRLAWDMLASVGLVNDPNRHSKMEIRTRTAIFFVQNKFNLIREECEGFAKLFFELCNPHDPLTPSSLHTKQREIFALSGQFGLDPNRVTDIILEAFERNIWNDTFFELLKHWNEKHVPHLLGFKFEHYSKIEKEPDSSLYELTAKLICAGVVKISDIWPSLSPSDENMEKECTEYSEMMVRAAKKKRAGRVVPEGLAHAVSTASLPADRPSAHSNEAKSSENPPYLENNQKVNLAIALLSMKEESMIQTTEYLKRLEKFDCFAHRSLSLALLQRIGDIIAPFQSLVRYNMDKRIVDEKDVLSGEKGREFLVSRLFPLLEICWIYLSRDPTIFCAVCRVVKAKYSRRCPSFSKAVVDLCTRVLVPALSCIFPWNPGCMADLWELLRVLDVSTRFGIYGEFMRHTQKDHYLLVQSKIVCEGKGRHVGMRITKENTVEMSRIIVRYMQINPFAVLPSLLSQLEKYSEPTEALVETFRFLPPYASDALSFSIMIRLSLLNEKIMKSYPDVARGRLERLSRFVALLCKRNTYIELPPLLRFVMKRVKQGSLHELLLFHCCIKEMGGLEIVDAGIFLFISYRPRLLIYITVNQRMIEAEGGGVTLRGDCGVFGGLMRTSRRAVNMLKRAVVKHNIALPMLILLGQTRRAAFQRDTECKDVKELAENYDITHDAILLLTQFLAENMSEEEYSKHFPSVEELCTRYGLEYQVAFSFARPSYTLPFLLGTHVDRRRKLSSKREETEEVRERKEKRVGSMLDVCEMEVDTCFHPGVGNILSVLPSEVWGHSLSEEVFSLFWSLDLYDISVPEIVYEREIQRHRDELSHVEQRGIDMKGDEMMKIHRSAEEAIRHLERERAEQSNRHSLVRDHLHERKTYLFSSLPAQTFDVGTAFFKYCVLRRCTYSYVDALYSAKFCELLFRIETPSFPIVWILSQIFAGLTGILYSSTENESRRFGVFLDYVLSLANELFGSEECFKNECQNKPQFVDGPSFEESQQSLLKWHESVADLLFSGFLSEDYMEMRMCLNLLIQISSNFPICRRRLTPLERAIEKLAQQTKYKDIQIQAERCKQIMKKRKEKLPDLMDGMDEDDAESVVTTAKEGEGSVNEEKEESLPEENVVEKTSKRNRKSSHGSKSRDRKKASLDKIANRDSRESSRHSERRRTSETVEKKREPTELSTTDRRKHDRARSRESSVTVSRDEKEIGTVGKRTRPESSGNEYSEEPKSRRELKRPTLRRGGR